MSGLDTRIPATVLLLPLLMAWAIDGDADPRVGPQDDDTRTVSVLENIMTVEESLLPTAVEERQGRRRVRRDSGGHDESRYNGLTEEDFELVAEEIGVEVAAIKAVVSIEAGSQMKGFLAPGVPVINFDNTMYARFRKKSGPGDKTAKVPGGLSGYGLREWTQLVNAIKVNRRAALSGTFWGMFQIGGFNYAKCGCEDIEEFVELMSFSELEQLELFAAFIVNAGMLDDLKKKNWASFARKYNGPSYARRGYHTKMAAAYKWFSKK